MTEAAAKEPAPRAPSRRTALTVGVAAAAGIAGAGTAWWLSRPDSSGGGGELLWPLSFDIPGGGSLAMAAFRGKPLLLNFWATWCPPCVEEMPMLEAFSKEQAARGWQVVGLAIDQPSSVRQFLARNRITYPIGLAGLGGTELAKALGNTSGGLPYTVVFAADGAVRERRMGKVSAADLARWASGR